MKYTFTIAALAALTAAQSIADLPSCSLSCVVSGVSSIGCSATDFECSCTKADQLTPAITPCVQKACPSAADQAKVITVLEGICAAAGFPISVPAPGASSSAAPAPTSAAPEPSKEASSSVAPTIQTSAPATPSKTDIVISSTGYAFPSATEESCVVVTVTVTKTSSSVVAPYPTSPVGTGVPPVVPSGTGSYSAPPSYFTGAAAGMKVPAVAGILGLAALVL
ncbi:hypothetical protein DPSP01_001086 [Paraphaeosphaeria sporulosa]|uniref:CFEM domain-containing protein n=1 Tax=Paraphaeosphaeria sporulosa TaxID=1460663 RepID=A0A177C587_9PLEO|nr:uncharacterized protein CC84DRAFT_1262069 [Paraphaeosphaeria sporulosa]OAG02049.1 hypothetical protein CC84DRAFT_1262069 [Paraphaeosphaeria sporulosa]